MPAPEPRALQALVSVRSADEALLAAQAGVRLIDLKEPRDGALGAVDEPELQRAVQALRGARFDGEISATVGDLTGDDVGAVLRQVRRTAQAGVDVVKAGVWPGPGAPRLLDGLAELGASGLRIVPVLIADRGWDGSLVEPACRGGFHALMLDTQDKLGASLLDALPRPVLQQVVQQARRHGLRVGLAGALRLEHLPELCRLEADFAGFRTAVCDGERSGALSMSRLQRLLQAVQDLPTMRSAGSGLELTA